MKVKKAKQAWKEYYQLKDKMAEFLVYKISKKIQRNQGVNIEKLEVNKDGILEHYDYKRMAKMIERFF